MTKFDDSLENFRQEVNLKFAICENGLNKQVMYADMTNTELVYWFYNEGVYYDTKTAPKAEGFRFVRWATSMDL